MFGYRIKKQYRTKVRLSCMGCLTFVVLIITSICRCTCSSCQNKDTATSKDTTSAHIVHLNDTLTNALTDQPELHGMDSIMRRYLKRWEINGAQLAISRNDSLLYARGFGFADVQKQQPMEPSYIMRMASVSKLVTAVGIMKLRDMGKLRLDEKVFGPNGVLNDTIYTHAIRDKRHFDITVEQLLRHTAGFNNRYGDPIFSTRYIMQQNHLTTPPDHRTLLQIVLQRKLGYTPGTMKHYCNIGYTLLSLIIEKRTGMSYEKFMQKYVLEPAGCYDFHIAGNYLKDRRPNETVYYMHSSSEPAQEFNNSGQLVERCYGENDITTALGAGAWTASAAELCRLVAAIDGDPTLPDVISDEAVKMMTEEMPDHQYSLGWNYTPRGGRWIRTGSLVGTSAIVLRYPDGECWVFITNTSTWKGHEFSKDTIALFEKLRQRFGNKMPKRNLFVK